MAKVDAALGVAAAIVKAVETVTSSPAERLPSGRRVSHAGEAARLPSGRRR